MNLTPMAKVTFRAPAGTNLSHQVGANECVHTFEEGPLVVNTESDPECFKVFELYATHIDVPITSQPAKPDKETA